MHDFDGVWAVVPDMALVLAGLAAFAKLVLLIGRRSRIRSLIQEMPSGLDRGREWELVVRRASNELARGPRVEALQADATVKIESAEYAYSRLVLDCAQHCNIPTAPPLEPTREPPREPEKAPTEERAPLAA